jgi:hypothetical protein
MNHGLNSRFWALQLGRLGETHLQHEFSLLNQFSISKCLKSQHVPVATRAMLDQPTSMLWELGSGSPSETTIM